MHFPVSGVDVFPLVPPLVTFLISLFTTSAGISGAFLLLPFQMSVLGFVSPAVTPTNLMYNVVAIPGGTYRYMREGRLIWPLAWTLIAGLVPGVFVGAVIRIRFLPNPRSIKLFVGFVLLYLGFRLLYDFFHRRALSKGTSASPPKAFRIGEVVTTKLISMKRIEYEFQGEIFSFNPVMLVMLSLAVGLVGGIYGIGGGAVLAPFLVSVLELPVYTVAGAALFGTLVSSLAGVGSFELLSYASMSAQTPVRPDWLLGSLFGVGGLFGTYFGARLQKHLPERGIRLLLGVLVTALALRYIWQFFV
jgi:uncharacterized membrane protein YfcA